jgi:hypothetical protein
MMVVLATPGTIQAKPPSGTVQAEEPVVWYSPNEQSTTPYGVAAADIVITPANFLPCYGGPISLCYYSGPEPNGKSQPDLSCDVTLDTSNGSFANCRCVVIPYGPYWVDIHAILDETVYEETVAACGESGHRCRATNSAPVCDKINKNELFAGAADPTPDTISAFSLALNPIPDYAIGQTNCTDQEALYAGCMTAPCVSTGESIEICENSKGNKKCISRPISECACPTVTGFFQVGQDKAKCDLSKGRPPENVWSAAYNPTQGSTAPSPPCIPDAPGESGCPLLARVPGTDPPEPIIPAEPSVEVCAAVCKEYRDSVPNDAEKRVELGYTCDATLCTANGDPDLVTQACSGLLNGRTSAILLLETEMGCSCCASQICGCEPNDETNDEIRLLNVQQRQRLITPQCDLNGTLCGGELGQ